MGRPVALTQYTGRKVLLTFNRAAVCPLCNVRTWHLINRYPMYRRAGLEVIAFFESSPHVAHQYLDRLDAPYPIVADLNHRVYDQYGLETSLLGVLRARLARGAVYREAAQRNIGARLVQNILGMDGRMGLMPAEFIVGEDGRILAAHYGRDAGDFLMFSEIDYYVMANRLA
jgi:hypothetical protein